MPPPASPPQQMVAIAWGMKAAEVLPPPPQRKLQVIFPWARFALQVSGDTLPPRAPMMMPTTSPAPCRGAMAKRLWKGP